jgi:hypothetical protein
LLVASSYIVRRRLSSLSRRGDVRTLDIDARLAEDTRVIWLNGQDHDVADAGGHGERRDVPPRGA